MYIKPSSAGPAVNRNHTGQAHLAQEDPLVQPDNARTHNTPHQRLSVGNAREKDVERPGSCSGHPTNAG